VSYTSWEKIKAARAMQNTPSPVPRICVCGHPMRAHRMDWDDPMADLAPDCGVVVTVVDPDTLAEHTAPCPCPEFTLKPVK
jgi:hypothetical protein